MSASVTGVGGAARRADLDWLRVGVFAGLIFYHEGLLYESGHRIVSVMLLATHPWRMSLLFLISGAATRFMTETVSATRLSAERSLRLLPPLAFAILFLIPVQAYLTLIETTAYAEGFPAFLRAYVSAADRAEVARQFNYALPVYGHLWFVFYLWAYTIALALALKLAPDGSRTAQRALERLLGGPALLIWPFVILAALRLVLFPSFGVTLRFVDDWYNHLVSGGMFLFGFLIARSDRLWVHIVRARWAALAMAVAGFAAYAVLGAHYGAAPETAEIQHPGMAVFYDLERWGAIVAVLGFGRRHLGRGAPSLRYLNGGVFTAYIVHEPAMLAAKHALKPLNLNVGVEMGLVALATLASCFLAYELARRIAWLGVALGQRRPGRLAFPPMRAQPITDQPARRAA
jgi:glucan biosynthesis protein C